MFTPQQIISKVFRQIEEQKTKINQVIDILKEFPKDEECKNLISYWEDQLEVLKNENLEIHKEIDDIAKVAEEKSKVESLFYGE